METEYWAKLTVHNFSQMKPKERLRVVRWLKDQAEKLRIDPDAYSDRYTARVMK